MSDYDQEEILRRKARRKAIKRRKRLALFVLSMLIIIALAVIVGLALGTGYLISGYKDYKAGLQYVEYEPTPLRLVENTFGSDSLAHMYDPVATKAPEPTVIPVVEEPVGTADEEPLPNGDTPRPTDVPHTEPTPAAHHTVTPDERYDASKHVTGLIIVDAGHGGYDGGTTNEYAEEKAINLDIAGMVKDSLTAHGFKVVMTRSDDSFIGLYERARLANEQTDPLALVSIHQNSVEDAASVKGIEAWTYNRTGCKELAALLSKCVAESTGSRDRGVGYRTNLVVTSKTTMPSAIIECGYMSNSDEAVLLMQPEYREKITQGIVRAVIEFCDTYYK